MCFVTCHTSSFGSEVTLWILVWSFISVDFHPDCFGYLKTSSCFYFSWCYCHIFPTVLDQILKWSTWWWDDQGASTGMAFTNRRIIPVPGFWDRCLELQFLEANFCWLIRSLLLLSYSDCMIRMKTLPLLVDWTTSTKNVFQHRPWGFKRREHRSRQMQFWPADVGSAVCPNSLVFPRQWKMLQALKMPPRAFFWASTRKGPLKPRFF